MDNERDSECYENKFIDILTTGRKTYNVREENVGVAFLCVCVQFVSTRLQI